MRRDPGDSQFAQSSPDLRRRHFHRILVHSRLVPPPLLVIAEQACFVRVKRYRPAELLHVAPQQLHILFSRIVPHEPRKQPTGRIVNHRDQIQLLPAPFQPVVLAGIPLHQFAKSAAPWPPPCGFPSPSLSSPATAAPASSTAAQSLC